MDMGRMMPSFFRVLWASLPLLNDAAGSKYDEAWSFVVWLSLAIRIAQEG